LQRVRVCAQADGFGAIRRPAEQEDVFAAISALVSESGHPDDVANGAPIDPLLIFHSRPFAFTAFALLTSFGVGCNLLRPATVGPGARDPFRVPGGADPKIHQIVKVHRGRRAGTSDRHQRRHARQDEIRLHDFK